MAAACSRNTYPLLRKEALPLPSHHLSCFSSYFPVINTSKETIKAVDLMMHDHILFDTFVGMPAELKYKWRKVQLDK